MNTLSNILLIDKFRKTKSFVITTGICFTFSYTYAGDIEQILPLNSNFTIDGNSGHEVMRAQSDGKVGIGTSSPNERLEINGHLRMTDGNEATNTIMVGDAHGTASWANISLFQDGTGSDEQNISLDLNTHIVSLENGGTIDLIEVKKIGRKFHEKYIIWYCCFGSIIFNRLC